jgi:hypothetical protein
MSEPKEDDVRLAIREWILTIDAIQALQEAANNGVRGAKKHLRDARRFKKQVEARMIARLDDKVVP